MGILLEEASFLAELARAGEVNFGNTITLGRQQIFFDPATLSPQLKGTNGGPADSFFKLLGANKFSSLDFSSYEGADINHDLNLPVPDDLKERYDVVYDGGTLEHVFNFPTALKSAMEMVKIGGHLICAAPANNFFGHGFYQFSPELFYSALSETNGYAISEMMAFEISPSHRSFSVRNPQQIGERVILENSWPVTLLVVAKRLEKRQIFAKPPQQSDYTVKWQTQPSEEESKRASSGRTDTKRAAKAKLKDIAKKVVPGLHGLTTFYHVFFDRRSGFSQRYFSEENRDRSSNSNRSP